MLENINPLLEGKKVPDPLIRYKSELFRVFEGADGGGILGRIFSRKSSRSLLSKESAELGLLLINQHPNCKDAESTWSTIPLATFNGERYRTIMKRLEDDWNSKDNFQLLAFFFGQDKAECVRHAWQQMPWQMYQAGASRRSFRSPANRSMYFQRQIAFLVWSLRQSFSHFYDSGYKYVYYDLSIREQIRFNHIIGDSNPELFRIWSAAIDLGQNEIFQLLEDIVYNKDEQGKLTRSIIKTLLNSNKQEAWVIVEKLLLAARRQEGLRQTVLESLDETSIGALKYMIRVLIDHDLARFSSVVRSVDVWAGLGWESERETTVRSFLEKASFYLEHQDAIPGACQSDNNADVYMALWAQGVYDVEKTLPFLQELYRTGDTQKRTLALLFAAQTAHYKIGMPLCVEALDDKDLQPIAVAVQQIQLMSAIGGNDAVYNRQFPQLFDKLDQVYKRFNVKQKTFASFVFSWVKITFERSTILKAMLALAGGKAHRIETLVAYMEDMDSTVKRLLSWSILPQYSGYNHSNRKINEPTGPLTPLQRKFALLILKDRSEFDIGYQALKQESFSPEELAAFPEWLKRKGAGFRGNIISILVHQDDGKLAPVVRELLKGDPEQRLAALDILLQLNRQERILPEAQGWIEEFRQRKISPKEEILLSQLITPAPVRDISAANGYGLFDPAKCAPVIRPAVDKNSLYEQLLARFPYALSMPMSKIKEAMWDLNALIEQHRNFEYESVDHLGNREKILLGNMFRPADYKQTFADSRDKYATFPLSEVWAAWYEKWKFEPRDLQLLALSCYGGNNVYRGQLPDKKEFVPEKYLPTLHHFGSPFKGILEALGLLHPMAEANEFFLEAAVRLFASFGEEELKVKAKESYWSSYGDGWQQNRSLHYFSDKIRFDTMDAGLIPRCWQLFNWRQYSGREENVEYSAPPLILFCRAYETGTIPENDMIRALCYRHNIRALSQRSRHATDVDFHSRFGFLRPMFDSVRDQILDVELQRGDTPTPLTPLASCLGSIYGIQRLKQILAGMGKTTLRKGYYDYDTSATDKQAVFSSLLKKCHPLDSDTQEQFDVAMKEINATEQRLIEAAVYAPQWQRFVSSYLGWMGLDTAIWWMHAHTKTDGYSAQNAEAESEIARYSSLDVEEFKDGAVDKEWFHNAISEIGKERWPLVYDAAKYITDGNGHRRARIYADVLQGNLTLKEVTEKISSKRDQDYVRIYGLVPLSSKHPQQDVLARYEFIQQFKKDSRQFGAQKQASEAAAVTIALHNLARNAGYPDPIRLTWAMETKQVQAILAKQTRIQYDDVTIALVIDAEGEANVVAFKEDKPLKAVPAKFKKDAKVAELDEFKKTLRDQFRRSRKSLEEAMNRGDSFQNSEIRELFEHPVIARHLEKLVFILADRTGHGFYREGMLIDDQGEAVRLSESDTLRIAHCTDLHQLGAWAGYQRAAFDTGLQQPFKQIFRELYLPTPDEQQEGSVSRRYAGHQVQPKQTVALLRTRGWKVNYEEGLQKVYHVQGFAARIYAMADWFSPADIESPTLETVVFTDLKTNKNLPFSSIHPRIFSEVMRDIDLVVSIAHAGGVDPEASHSTIEMRAVLLKETIRLFKLNNVAIDGSHALIKGTMGEYSVHLGSAVVHRMLSGYLSILPVQSQHRGRIFLPFVDDDPRSAELLSKVLLLARDNEIKDPLILQQLR